MNPDPAKPARWFSHVNGVRPTHEMRGWQVDPASLTQKLARHRVYRRRHGALLVAELFLPALRELRPL